MELLPTAQRGLNALLKGGSEARLLMSSLLQEGKLVYLDPSLGTKSRLKVVDGGSIGLLGPVPLPVNLSETSGLFNWYVFCRTEDSLELPRSSASINSILLYGNPERSKIPPIVRLHSACHTGDILGSMRCDCGPQLREALKRILEYGSGALVYITNHEGRGIGLWAKALAYILQDRGYDTYEANGVLGFPEDARNYFDSLVVLRHLLGKSREIKLLSNHPQNKTELESQSFKVIETLGLVAGVNPSNLGYLRAKVKHGHTISSSELR